MILSRFVEWGVALREVTFPGRSLAGKLYRLFLFGLFNPCLQLAYSLRFSLRTRSWHPFSLPDYRLLREVRSLHRRPYLIRRWFSSKQSPLGPLGPNQLITKVNAMKGRIPHAPWLLPETALLSPALDCKGFAVLLSALCNVAGFTNELWVGLPADGKAGHAWVVVETGRGRKAVDQFNGSGTDEAVYRHQHPFAMTFRI
jgi:hypothetical protein